MDAFVLLDIAWTDLIWIIFGVLLTVFGLLGCFLPIIPGPPLSFAGLLLLQLKAEPPFATNYMLIWAGITIAVTVLDYVIPVIGAKKFGASKAGIWGSVLGLVVGVFFGPLGIIIGPFVGALIGELIVGKKSGKAFKAAFGTFLGFVFGTLIKLIASGYMAYEFFTHLV